MRNLETSRTEAAGTPDARTITTQWHSNFRLPIKTISPDGIKTFDYNANGQITQVDGARTDVADLTNYSYDALGHITRITQYDAAGHPLSITDPNGLITTLSYDSRGRLITQDKGGEITRYSYDKTGALLTIIQPDNTHIDYRYDAAHRLVNLQNSQGDSLTYTLDAMGNRLREDWKNPSGTLTKTLQRQYDGFARLSQTRFVDGTLITYQYDTATNGIGRLAKVTDPSGTTARQYDPHGRITTKLQTINLTNNGGGNRTLTTRYRYDSPGRLTETTYPLGLKVAYGYTDGNIASLKLNGKAWLNTIRYQPDGAVAAWTWADGSQQQRGYDQDGQLISQTLGAIQHTLNHDDAGNITAILNNQTALNLNYDAADCLIATNNQHWQYDPNSNRIQQQDNSGVTDYRIDPSSNRLLSSTGVNYQNYQYDANGNTLQDTAHSYRYDAQNRLVAVDNGKTAHYRHNALGQRVYKKASPLNCDDNDNSKNADVHTVNGKESDAKTGSNSAKGDDKENSNPVTCTANQSHDTQEKDEQTASGLLFAYDETGKLIGEYTTNGNAQQETVWLGNLPIATIKDNTPYAIHTDHLGTPRVITDTKKRVIWRWNSDPFGATLANEDPDGDGKTFIYNLRFAGQYYDQETGLHYNYFRDYDPRTGRYIESDPIGLDGGINTYGYVGGNPVNWVDPLGLDSSDSMIRIPIPVPSFNNYGGNNAGDSGQNLNYDAYNNRGRGRYERPTERPSRPDPMEMAKGGKTNIDNEYVRDVQEKGKSCSDPCAYLKNLYANEKDTVERQKIYQAMKRYDCDGKNRFDKNKKGAKK